MCDALVLPDHDLTNKTRPGHAPAGPYGEFGPRQPSKGARIGDHLGATHQVGIRNAPRVHASPTRATLAPAHNSRVATV